jgi:hypothetical protein
MEQNRWQEKMLALYQKVSIQSKHSVPGSGVQRAGGTYPPHTRIRNSCKAPPRLCMGQTISSTYSTLTDKPPDFLTQSSSCWQGRMRHHSGRAAVGARRSSGSLEGVPIAMVAAIVALEVSFAVPPSSKHLTISFPRFALVTEPGCGGSVLWLLGSGWWRTVRSKIDGFCFLGGLQG